MMKSKNYSKIFWREVKKIPNSVAIIFVLIYRKILSPSVGILRFLPFYPKPSCIFYPTCSEYAVECFTKYSFPNALQKTINRIGRCRPDNTPSVDLP